MRAVKGNGYSELGANACVLKTPVTFEMTRSARHKESKSFFLFLHTNTHTYVQLVCIIGECAEPKQKAQTRKMAAKEQKPPSLRRGRFKTRRTTTLTRGREVVVVVVAVLLLFTVVCLGPISPSLFMRFTRHRLFLRKLFAFQMERTPKSEDIAFDAVVPSAFPLCCLVVSLFLLLLARFAFMTAA